MIDDIREIVHRKQWDGVLNRESYNTLFQYIDNYESDDLNLSSLISRNIIILKRNYNGERYHNN